jgi:uncharacterized protein (DUF305 family)
MVRRRLGCWVILVVVAAGCGNPSPDRPTASEQTDVWFMQHMVPHLRQTTSVVVLTRKRITRPELTRLADTINQQGQANLQQLQGWLDRRGWRRTATATPSAAARRPTSSGCRGFMPPGST